MSRNAVAAKLLLLLVVLATVSLMLGNEPWGPR